MASLFQVPTPNLGLMGRRPQRSGMAMPQNGLEALLAQVNALPVQQPMMADAGDEMFARRDQERAAADQAALGGNRPRERVSGWRLLDRVLGGQTVTEGLDAERARLQTQANAPSALARDQQILQSIQDPRERALFLADREEWAKNVGQQFAPQVGAPGTVQYIGGRAAVGNSQQYDQGDQRRSYDPITQQDTLVNERGPTYAESTARFNAENPVLPANSTWVGPNGVRAQGYIAPEVVSTPQGGTTNVFDQQGRVINQVQGNPETRVPRVVPDAVRRDNEKDQTEIEARKATIDRVANAVALIDNGVINLDPAARASAWIRNNTGNSSDGSRAQAELRRTVETLRNNILNDAAGPQTDGDSLRALNQIIQGWGDENVVRDGLNAYLEIQRSKSATQQSIMDNRLAQYGDTSAGYGGGSAASAPAAISREAAIAEARRRGLIP